MRYITAEQFWDQPMEVQQVFKNWAELNFNAMDLIYDAYNDEINHIEEIHDTRGQDIDLGRCFYLHKYIVWGSMHDPDITPLFTLQQLWEFIEDKTNYPVTVTYLADEYWIQTDDWWQKEDICFIDGDKLQAFWKCACEVAKSVKVLEYIDQFIKDESMN